MEAISSGVPNRGNAIRSSARNRRSSSCSRDTTRLMIASVMASSSCRPTLAMLPVFLHMPTHAERGTVLPRLSVLVTLARPRLANRVVVVPSRRGLYEHEPLLRARHGDVGHAVLGLVPTARAVEVLDVGRARHVGEHND